MACEYPPLQPRSQSCLLHSQTCRGRNNSYLHYSMKSRPRDLKGLTQCVTATNYGNQDLVGTLSRT